VRVLIAEDSDIERMVLQEAVEGLGHECVTAADGSQAWDIFQRSGADVLVSDWRMPGLEGPELCRRVRAHPTAPYTYVVMLTALDDKESTLAGMAAGADDYLTKPLDIDELEARLVAAARVTSLHQQLSGQAVERERSLARRQALLGLARRLAAENDADRMLSDLLAEATALLGGTGGLVSRWDASQRMLVPVRSTVPSQPNNPATTSLSLASTRSIQDRSIVVGSEPATMAAPLIHDNQLLGAIAVADGGGDEAFPAEAGDVLEQLASIGAAALVGLDRARMDGAVLAMQTLHELDPRPLQRTRPNLPAQATPLIGREREVELVRQLILTGDANLVTLTGPAGIGKTRLAVAVAASLIDAFERRVVFVDLLPERDPRDVLPAIARSLGARGLDHDDADEWLRSELGQVPLLLVLDNAEHVLGAASDVAALVRACARLRVLVTSREPLQVQVEHQVPVPPLPIADLSGPLSLDVLARSPAVALFVQRAQAADPTFHLSEENARLVVEICARLDGLPLAIELAAARTRVLPTWSLPARLEQQPLALLTGGLRDQPERHQTLRAAIAWSYTLLDDAERREFRRLGVFVGGLTLPAAAAVAEISQADVQERIGALMIKSLLRRVDAPGNEPRFQLLETIRQYALEQLASEGERDAVQDRHAMYFLTLAEQAERGSRGAEQAAWLDRLEREHDNLRAALRWLAHTGQLELELRLASALGWYWAARGHAAEGRATLQRSLERAGSVPAVGSRSRAIAAAVALAVSDADWSAARSLYEQCLALTGRDAATLAGLALVRARQRDRGAARDLAEEALRRAEEHDDRHTAGLALRVLGEVATDRGAFVQAHSFYAASLEVFQALADRIELARTLEACAILAMVRTHAQRALRLAGAAATLRSATGAVRGREAGEALARWLELAREAVGEQRAAAAEAEGGELTPEQAIELANAPIEPELIPAERSEGALHPLSERETQVAVLVARGWTNRQIASELHLSERTVEAHLRRILTRLGFASRTPLATWVVQQGGLRSTAQ
jgi:predicted ATPase/DNA-binding NarL/FixJ family response regulator